MIRKSRITTVCRACFSRLASTVPRSRRILAILPHLPEEADGDVWEAARAMLEMDLDNADLVRLADEAERRRRDAK